MSFQRFLAAATALAACLSSGSAGGAPAGEKPATALLIRGASVFDATGAPPRKADVLVVNGRIAKVGAGVRGPRGARTIDARGLTLLPGLFDLHTHWTPGGQPDNAAQIARAYALAGVTTVDDFHSQPEAYAAKRRWLTGVVAPHVNYIARVGTPGGHGTDWGDENTTKSITTPESARVAIRQLLPYRPDRIKAFNDGWRYGTSPNNNSITEEALTALVDEAHRNDLKVVTHTVTVARGKEAARAGVDVIVHSVQDGEVDAELIALLKASKTFYAPTLAVYEPRPEKVARATPAAAEQSRRKFGFALRNAKVLHDAGIPIALGTDAGMPGTPHGSSTHRELALLVEAGLTPSQALIAGTANSARAAGLIADRGTIEAGKRADLLLVDGEPWRDIAAIERVRGVVIDGRVVAEGENLVLKADPVGPQAVRAAARIADFERADGRSSLDTVLISDTNAGMDRSTIAHAIVPRPGGGHALAMIGRMSSDKEPSAGISIPLTRGSFVPADAGAFQGVRLSVRGEGPYDLTVMTASGPWRAAFDGRADWRRVEIPFTAFKPVRGKSGWDASALHSVGVAIRRPSGTRAWLEIDDVEFY
jgi:imidazolonepropionase-like amidohydrolase